MSTSNLYTFENTKMSFVILAAAAFFIIFVGGYGVFLVEHGHPGANITQYSDALWWAVVTLATVRIWGLLSSYGSRTDNSDIHDDIGSRNLCTHGSHFCKEKIAESRGKIRVGH